MAVCAIRLWPKLEPAHPAIAATGKTIWMAINLDERGGRALTIARIDAKESLERFLMPNSAGADHPQLIALPDQAIVAWTEKKGDASSIKLARLSDSQ